MTALHFHAMGWVALAAGVGIFLGPIGGDENPPTPRQFAVHVLCGLAALALSYFLALRGHVVWMFFIVLFATFSLTHSCRLLLENPARRWRSCLVWIGALVLIGVLFQAAERAAGRLEYQEYLAKELVREREARLVQEMRNLRRPWRAWPEEGVGELVLDRLKIWFAVAPRIYIDASYERELGLAARRQIPVRIAFFNDSFQAVSQVAAAGLTPARWSLQIRNPANSIVREWRVKTASLQPLQPAERRDFHLVWDGRDNEGTLVPAGDYSVVVEVHTHAGHGSRALAMAVQEAGPIETLQADPTTQYIESQQNALRWHQILQEGTRQIQQLQIQQLRR